jgi:hypothetical protein
MKDTLKVIYFHDYVDPEEEERELNLIQNTLKENGIILDIVATDLPPKEDEYYDIMFFDWGGMSLGNSMLDHFCEHWIEDARNKPDRIYIMTSFFTSAAMQDALDYATRETEEFPKNIFLTIDVAIPYLKEFIKSY